MKLVHINETKFIFISKSMVILKTLGETRLHSSGDVFLPIGYSPLTVTSPISIPRVFSVPRVIRACQCEEKKTFEDEKPPVTLYVFRTSSFSIPLQKKSLSLSPPLRSKQESVNCTHEPFLLVSYLSTCEKN